MNKVMVNGQARKPSTLTTTPAPTLPKLEEQAKSGEPEGDETEPLSDKG